MARQPSESEHPELVRQGNLLIDLLFHRAFEWCNRRALLFEFEQERRGQWSNIVDFDQPEVRHIGLLRTANRDRVRLPVMSFSKDLLPPAHFLTSDERGDVISLEESHVGRRIAFAILLAAGERAAVCGRCGPPILWRLSDSNTVVAHEAWRDLHSSFHTPDHGSGVAWSPNRHVTEFLMLARLVYRSALIVLNLKAADTGDRKIITVSHDGPIRVTRRLGELMGLTPRVVAPRAIFGGNARSYHIQMLPPERVTIVDSRVLYSYYGTGPLRGSGDHQLNHPDCLMREGRMTDAIGARGEHEWWGVIEGPAEPMSAHVRGSGERIPPLQAGRDCYGVFQFYPQFTGVLSQHLVTAFTNLAFVLAFVFSLQFHPSLRGVLQSSPEAVFIVAVLVAGFGVGLTLYPKEHMFTSSVLRPWRRLEALVLALTVAAPITSLWAWNDDRHAGMPVPMEALWVEAIVDFVLVSYISFITYRAWVTETNGGRGWRRTGLRLRRSGFPHFGQAIDDREVARRVTDSRWAAWVTARDRHEAAKCARIERRFVRKYLVEERRQQLLDRGIPPSARHSRADRSW